jgi:hypothetical protein
MIQWCKREKSIGDQNCPVVEFPFVFQETSDDDFCQMDYVPSHPSGQLVEECEKNNISKNQHDPTVNSRDMATEALLVPPNSASLFSRILYCLSHTSFFFLNCWPFAVLKAHFPLITFISLIYIFMYFILFLM